MRVLISPRRSLERGFVTFLELARPNPLKDSIDMVRQFLSIAPFSILLANAFYEKSLVNNAIAVVLDSPASRCCFALRFAHSSSVNSPKDLRAIKA